MAPAQFDLIAIGTGAAASAAAYKCRKAGWQVAVVDSRPFGGTCQLRGCDPKKVLVGAGALIDAMRRMRGKGIKSDGAHIDWSELMCFKRTFTWKGGFAGSHASQGIFGCSATVDDDRKMERGSKLRALRSAQSRTIPARKPLGGG